MKPFNLQEALAGNLVVTRDGRMVKIAGHNPDAVDSDKILGWVDCEIDAWHEDGRWKHSIANHKCDLFMAPTERKEWVVVRTRVNSGKRITKGPFPNFSLAEMYISNFPGATIHEITIIE